MSITFIHVHANFRVTLVGVSTLVVRDKTHTVFALLTGVVGTTILLGEETDFATCKKVESVPRVPICLAAMEKGHCLEAAKVTTTLLD